MFRYSALLVFAGLLTNTIAHSQTCPLSSYTLSGRPGGDVFSYQGRTEVLLIQTAPGCPWAVTNLPSWITVVGPSSGVNTASVELAVETNLSTAPRSQSVLIGGRVFPASQGGAPGPCVFSLQATAFAAPPDGGSGPNTLNTSTPSCAWFGFADKRWLQVYPNWGVGGTSFTYTVFPNFSTLARGATGNIAAQRFTVTQPGTTGTYNERLVRLLYFNFLGRLPAPNEVAFHAQNLNSGMSPVDLAFNFLNTTEFNLVGRFIAGLYVGLLARDAEFGGWLFQRNAVIIGLAGLNGLVGNFLGSAEYAARFGMPDDPTFVTLLYQYILLRQPAPSEVQFHTSNLAAGMTRAQLATNFLNTAEFRTGRGPRLTAFLLYATLLSRDPSIIELNDRVQQLQASPDPDATIKSIIQQIMMTTEFSSALA